MVGVVGASHLSGMQRLWDSGGWREMVAGGLLEAPQGPPVPESPDATGVRWAAAARGAQRQAQLQGRAGGARATPSSERPWTDALAGAMRWHGSASNPSAGGRPLRMCAAGRWPARLPGPASALPPRPPWAQACAVGWRDPPVVPHRRAAGCAAGAGPRAGRVGRGVQPGARAVRHHPHAAGGAGAGAAGRGLPGAGLRSAGAQRGAPPAGGQLLPAHTHHAWPTCCDVHALARGSVCGGGRLAVALL